MKNKLFLPLLLSFFSFFHTTMAQSNFVDFDGIDDYIEIPNSADINFDTNDDFTVEVWLKIPSTNQLDRDVGDNDVIEKWSQSGAYPFVIRYLNINAGSNYGKINVVRYDLNVAPSLVSTMTLNDDTWHHIAFVKDGANLHLYIDGVLDGTTADNTVATTQNTSSLFLARRGCCGFDNIWKGGMDELRIWNVARSGSEINGAKDIELVGSEANLVAYYNFNEGICADDNTALVSPELADLSMANNATMNNFAKDGCSSNLICEDLPVATAADLSANLVSYWPLDFATNDRIGVNAGSIIGSGYSYASGRFSNGIDLDGGNTYIDAGNDISLDMTGKSVTISAWFRVDGFTEFWQALIAKGENQNMRIHRFSDSDNIAYNGGSPDIFSPVNINDGQFHHVVAVTENGVRKNLYLDGQLVATSVTNPVITDTGLSLLIGNNPDILSRDWNGMIDDVAIWDRALTQCEITTLYSSQMSLEELLMLPAIPTLSEWGILILSITFIILGLVAIKQTHTLVVVKIK